MSRKIFTLILTLCMIISCVITVPAAELDEAHRTALEAMAALEETTESESADSGSTVSVLELNGLSLTQLAAGTHQLQKDLDLVRRNAANSALAAAAAKSVLLTQYGGVLILSGSIRFYVAADGEANVIRSINGGKVARLLDTLDGWYKVKFDGSVGYLKADECLPVRYDDYKGTLATTMLVEDLIAYARTYLGTPYVFGGASYRGIDCSGFTMRVFGHFGYSLPHSATGQYRMCRRVSDSERRPGDLVFFNTVGTSTDHVGIYLGNGLFIHAGSITGVAIRSLSENYFARHYTFSARLIGK